MNITSCHSIYFSPTNTSRKIADVIVKQIGAKKTLSTNITSYETRQIKLEVKENLAVIAVPVYFGRVEPTAMDYIKNNLSANNTFAIVVVVYGNRHYDDALVELRDEVNKKGFIVISAGVFIGEHTFSTDEIRIGHNRPNENDLIIAKEFAYNSLKKIAALNESNIQPLSVKGNIPYRELKGLRDLQICPVPKLKKQLCIDCKQCAKSCPAQAIDIENVENVEKDKCIFCMKCVKECPTSAKFNDNDQIKIAAKELSEEEYKIPEVFL